MVKCVSKDKPSTHLMAKLIGRLSDQVTVTTEIVHEDNDAISSVQLLLVMEHSLKQSTKNLCVILLTRKPLVCKH